MPLYQYKCSSCLVKKELLHEETKIYRIYCNVCKLTMVKTLSAGLRYDKIRSKDIKEE